MHQWRSERQAIYRMAMPIDTAQRVVKSNSDCNWDSDSDWDWDWD